MPTKAHCCNIEWRPHPRKRGQYPGTQAFSSLETFGPSSLTLTHHSPHSQAVVKVVVTTGHEKMRLQTDHPPVMPREITSLQILTPYASSLNANNASHKPKSLAFSLFSFLINHYIIFAYGYQSSLRAVFARPASEGVSEMDKE